MSLRPQPPLPSVPDDTARIARAAFRRGNPYLLLRDRLGAVFADAGFADLYPALGQPAYAPWRLALVTIMLLRDNLGWLLLDSGVVGQGWVAWPQGLCDGARGGREPATPREEPPPSWLHRIWSTSRD